MIKHLFPMRFPDAVLAGILLLQILFFILCMAAICNYMSVHAGSGEAEETRGTGEIEGPRAEHYMSIQICPGESLWEISRRYYSSEYGSVGQYMEKIMRLNNMADGDIHSGAYLIIPYYD